MSEHNDEWTPAAALLGCLSLLVPIVAAVVAAVEIPVDWGWSLAIGVGTWAVLSLLAVAGDALWKRKRARQQRRNVIL